MAQDNSQQELGEALGKALQDFIKENVQDAMQTYADENNISFTSEDEQVANGLIGALVAETLTEAVKGVDKRFVESDNSSAYKALQKMLQAEKNKLVEDE